MKKIFLFLCTIFCTMILFSCGEISTLKFYKACLTGKEELVNKYISQEEYSLELTDKEIEKFVKTLEDFDSDGLFWLDYEDIFIDNPIAVSILGKNESITKTLCENISFSEDDEDDIIYTTAKMNDTAMGIYLYEQRIFPITYLSFITMIENDNVELFKLYSILIDDITAPVNKNDNNLLMIAVEEDAVNCVKYLVDTKLFDINKFNKDYQTALGLANYYGASSEIKTYLKNAKGECLHDIVRDLVQRFDSMTARMENLCKSKDYTYNDVLSTIQAFNSLIDSSQIKMIDLPRNMSDWQKEVFWNSFDRMEKAFQKLQYL